MVYLLKHLVSLNFFSNFFCTFRNCLYFCGEILQYYFTEAYNDERLYASLSVRIGIKQNACMHNIGQSAKLN